MNSFRKKWILGLYFIQHRFIISSSGDKFHRLVPCFKHKELKCLLATGKLIQFIFPPLRPCLVELGVHGIKFPVAAPSSAKRGFFYFSNIYKGATA